MSEAPTELWADWDYDANDGVCGVHTHKRYASGYEPDFPPIRYVRADRIEGLEAALSEQIQWVRELADELIAAEGREAKLKAKLAKAVEALEFWQKAQEPDIDEAIERMQTTLAELKGIIDE